MLACLEKYPIPDTLEEFAHEFGYDLLSEDGWKKAKKTWIACQKEYEKVLELFGDVMPELREIW